MGPLKCWILDKQRKLLTRWECWKTGKTSLLNLILTLYCLCTCFMSFFYLMLLCKLWLRRNTTVMNLVLSAFVSYTGLWRVPVKTPEVVSKSPSNQGKRPPRGLKLRRCFRRFHPLLKYSCRIILVYISEHRKWGRFKFQLNFKTQWEMLHRERFLASLKNHCLDMFVLRCIFL